MIRTDITGRITVKSRWLLKMPPEEEMGVWKKTKRKFGKTKSSFKILNQSKFEEGAILYPISHHCTSDLEKTHTHTHRLLHNMLTIVLKTKPCVMIHIKNRVTVSTVQSIYCKELRGRVIERLAPPSGGVENTNLKARLNQFAVIIAQKIVMDIQKHFPCMVSYRDYDFAS